MHARHARSAWQRAVPSSASKHGINTTSGRVRRVRLLRCYRLNALECRFTLNLRKRAVARAVWQQHRGSIGCPSKSGCSSAGRRKSFAPAHGWTARGECAAHHPSWCHHFERQRRLCRHTVQAAYYSTPLTAPPEERSGEAPCPEDRYCIEGVAYACGLPQCWPIIASATAQEAGPLNLRKAGLSNGDQVVVVFAQNTTMPVWDSSTLCYAALSISANIGVVSCAWASPATLILTVDDASGANDVAVTRIGVLNMSLQHVGGVRYWSHGRVNCCRHFTACRRINTTTQIAFQRTRIVLDGTWGIHVAPIIPQIIARGDLVPQVRPYLRGILVCSDTINAAWGSCVQLGNAPGFGDTIDIVFDKVRASARWTRAQSSTASYCNRRYNPALLTHKRARMRYSYSIPP
jgi:hypothetical protein